MQTASVELGDDTDHAAESAAIVREAIGKCGLPLEQGGLDALTTVENFLDVWHLPANAARRPRFLLALAEDGVTVERTLALAAGEGAAGRVALGLLNRLAQDAAAGPLLLPRLYSFLDTTRGAAAGTPRLMWLETSGSLLRHSRDPLPVDFAAFLAACVSRDAEAKDEEAAIVGELTALLAAQILARHGAGAETAVLHALAAGQNVPWRCERALEGLAELLLEARRARGATGMLVEEVAAEAALRAGADKQWRQCGLWLAAARPAEPRCRACGAAGRLLNCGACGTVRYCSFPCQKNDWMRHKPECRKPRP
jgi:hypothetical protein